MGTCGERDGLRECGDKTEGKDQNDSRNENKSESENSKKGSLDVKLRMEGEIVERFLRIKRAKGLRHNSEVLRLLINEYFTRNLRKKAA